MFTEDIFRRCAPQKGLDAHFRYQKCRFKKKREQMARAKQHYLPGHVWQ
jgi:hypothetical protein